LIYLWDTAASADLFIFVASRPSLVARLLILVARPSVKSFR
jgi:hypothetical protein